MPWVRAHRRRVPYSWFKTTRVESHHRSRPGSKAIIGLVIAFAVILLLIVIF
ncbi:hypothetical protein [Umezawaea sp. Da 62-37]|uniref:hypothetical protein n=1 Tax=Umezawaea sp. Da 62-37 TaxID=3075927 RepID=UPI0028F71278|nr:hypothetical protein [Umezawaea sp. Da 62-37]WNV86029.1 hypothetical protein RM788_49275 [Umezawaea sp. Da 62-37]